MSEDIGTILKFTEHEQGVAIRNWEGARLSQPDFGDDSIRFNGCGPDDDHETMIINRHREKQDWQDEDARGWGFCKTARKPYDIAVTACLCYLATVTETHSVSTDGNGGDWLAGLELARQALPRYANQLDIPIDILKADRWRGGYLQHNSQHYTASACVDGFAYVVDDRTGKSYRFENAAEMKAWAEQFVEPRRKVYSRWSPEGFSYEGGKSIFDAWGSFDEKRTAALLRAQEKAFRELLATATGDRALPPPAFVRPGELPVLAEPLQSLAEIVEAGHG